MSVSNQMKELREILGVKNNTEVKDAVQALQQPNQPIVLAVSWVPGQPPESASLTILAGGEVPFHILGAVLRAGNAVIDINAAQTMQRMGMQLQQQQETKEPEP